MRTFRDHASDIGRRRASTLARRVGMELRIARMNAGLTQDQVARRAGMDQTSVSRLEAGRLLGAFDALSRATAAVGHELAVRLYPTSGVSLRDSGQLEVALALRNRAHESWEVALEVPVGWGTDRRAADMVLRQSSQVIHVEIERSLIDLQAQLRAAQLKRKALADREGRAVALVLALPDTRSARRVVSGNREAISAALPTPPRVLWDAIENGRRLDGDGLLWVRVA